MESVIRTCGFFWSIADIFVVKYNNAGVSASRDLRCSRTVANAKTAFRILVPLTTAFAFWVLLIYDLIDFFRNSSWLANYLNQQNRVITLMALFHPAFCVLRTCLTVVIVLWKSKEIRQHRRNLKVFSISFGISDKTILIAKAWLLLLCVLLNVIVCIRVVLATIALLNSNFWKVYPWGFFHAPHWIVFVIYSVGTICGGLIFTSIVTKTLSMTTGVVICCQKLNFAVQELFDLQQNSLNSHEPETSVQVIEGLRRCRNLQEELYNLITEHEDIFNMYFFTVVTSINLTLFSALATLFRPRTTSLSWANCLLACVFDFVIILMLIIIPARIHEKNAVDVELAQKLLYRLQSGCRSLPILSPERMNSQTAEVILMQFIQRAVFCPPVLTVGVCVNLSRGFLVTWCCILFGFIGFLIEKSAEFESDKAEEVDIALLCNFTSP
ncbi:uncharacterized protein LOC129601816 [Paramacrobiotus metropolitanus]|uniref:uncharacterized protein LOC129601816 n=1 Tax=Paramacrobiotus metropolitanus TaxID=2943436 RepID=UPI0024465154|nr:uncharacterized protein LOC129601816 [Paramacrobiotus metropolitanus]